MTLQSASFPAGSKRALVLGPTGGIGRQVANLLAARGWHVRAMHRSPERFANGSGFEWVHGDALVAADVEKAARDVDVIVHAVKPRDYRDWAQQVLPMIDNSIAAAKGARLIVPGNVYNFGPDVGPLIPETAPQHPVTRKGQLRAEMERRIRQAALDGSAEALIVRAGDFFGPGAGSSWLSDAMVKPGRRLKAIYNPARLGVGHQWVYLPDLAQTMVQLVEARALPPFARFHMDGHWDADGMQMPAAIMRVLGRPEIKVKKLPWWLISAGALISRDMRELTELKYLWDRPVRLSNDLLVATLGEEPHTPLDEAIRQTLSYLSIT